MNEVRSVLPNVIAPAVPSPMGAALLAMQYQLDLSQWLPPEDLFRYQARQLHNVFQHARATVPFYRERLAGYRPDMALTPAFIASLPILTRSDIQEAGDLLQTAQLPQGHGKMRPIESSGSTGRSVRVMVTDVTHLFWLAFGLRDHFWHARDFMGTQAAIRWASLDKGMPPGVEHNGWGTGIDEAFLSGRSVFLNIAAETPAQAEWLVRHDPHYLITYPSQMLTLADYFRRHGLKLNRLREIRSVGESLSDTVREVCREVWGVPVSDIYSCEEAGSLALQCPEHEHYHVQSENVYLEIVDENGQPCAPGTPGRVLITTLQNFATPLIRYEVGDYAVAGTPCACGRGLPVLTRILGRKRNRLVLPGGETRFPYLGERPDYRAICPDYREFQFVQHSETEIEFRLARAAPMTPDQEERMRELIRRNLGYPFTVTITYHDRVPRGARNKFEEFVSELAAGRTPD